MKFAAYIKKRVDAIAVLLLGVFAGAGLGSAFDRFLIALDKASRRYPFRVLFDQIFSRLGVAAAALTFIAYLLYLVTREDIGTRGKILRFLLVMLAACGLVFLFSVLWLEMIGWIHDFKQAVGWSRP